MNKILISAVLSGFMLCLNILVNGQQNNDTLQNANKTNFPVATICGVYSGMIEKDTLIKAERLICSGKTFEIISFTMFNISNELRSAGSLLTMEMKKCLSDMRSGSKLMFLDIKAKSPDGKIKILPPIILKIK